MKNYLSTNLFHFINKYHLAEGKILIAVSAGIDSMTLLDLFLTLPKSLNLKIMVVHVHHGWREESDQEFEFLEKFCISAKLPFYGKKLHLSKNDTDAENKARKARYEFFKQIYDETGASGLFLGHQLDDLEETVIKRIYEGALISNLGAIKEKSHLLKMNVYRPLLGFKKSDLINYAQVNKIQYFEDATNVDPKYLRSRLRLEYFPMLENIFGKNKGLNLAKLAKQSDLMSDFFKKRFHEAVITTDYESDVQVFSFKEQLHYFEIFHLVSTFFKKREISLPYAMLNSIAEAIESSSKPKQFNIKNYAIFVSRGFLLLISKDKRLDQEFVDGAKTLIAKLPAWFYKKVPDIKNKINTLTNYSS